MGNDERLVLLDQSLPLLVKKTGVSIYDFAFEQYFPVQRLACSDPSCSVIARIGAIADYPDRFHALEAEGTRLTHTPEEHERCSTLPGWYPLLLDLTPRSIWFDEPPEATDLGSLLGWPVFIKGARQTSRHQRSLCIIDGPESFSVAMEAWQRDPILRWQQVVCREFIPLRIIDDSDPTRLPVAFEYRTFWWRGQLVGIGPYWWQARPYRLTRHEEAQAISLGMEAARRVAVSLLVVDLAQTATGQWIVIECNDGQESGYAGISPVALWQRILMIEREMA